MNGEERLPETSYQFERTQEEQGGPLAQTPTQAGWAMADVGHFVELLKEFIVDKSIPEHIREEFMYFGMTSKHLLFGNFQPEDVKIFTRKFYIVMDKFRNSMPSYKLTYHQQMLIDNLEMVFRAILTRAAGPFRERILQSTQIRQQITTSDMNRPTKRGFFGKIFGFGRKQPGQG